MAQSSAPGIISNVTATLQRLAGDVSGWISDHYVELIAAIIIGAVIFAILGGIKRLAARNVEKSDNLVGYRGVILRTIARTSKIFMIIVSAQLIVAYTDPPAAITKTVGFLFIIAAAIQSAIWLRELVLGFFQLKLATDLEHYETLHSATTLIRLLVTFVIFAIAVIVILANLGVNVTGLIAGLGVGGIAIGLAAQGIFSDLFAALSIIFDKPFKQGDTISYDTSTGTIERIGLKSTRLRAVNGEELIISNTNLLNKEITNLSRLDRRRTRFAIGVIYQTKPDDARRIPELLKAIVEAHDAVFLRAGFVGFGDSSINFELDFDIMAEAFETVFYRRHMIGLAILQKFNEEGLEFAYPTQTTFTAAPDGEMIMPYPESGFLVKE